MFKGVVFLACLVTCCSAQVPCHAGFFGSKGQACRGGCVIRSNIIASGFLTYFGNCVVFGLCHAQFDA